MTTTEKKFDCIAFKRSAQLLIYEEIKNLTREEQLAYFRSRAESGPLGEWWKRKPIANRPIIAHAATLCAESGEIYDHK